MAERPSGHSALAEIGVIGGSGFYSFLDDVREVAVDTPYGPPSDPLVVGEVAGRRIAFVPRHGRDHRFPPHRVPYRANVWALRAVGVRQILAPSAVGSLQPALAPGSIVVPDQLVDRTSGRPQTFHDTRAGHVAFADPYCPRGRRTLLSTAEASGVKVVDGGTLVVIEGPRFSTRAESQWFARQGWSLVGMTGHPEAALARELALCYSSVALVTDVDAGLAPGEEVRHGEVLRVFAENTERLKGLLFDSVAALSTERDCPCPGALDDIDVGFELP